jgi:hypothetical protein
MQNWRVRLVAFGLVVVAVLAAGALLGHDSAVAAPCCSSCEAGYYSCLAGCGYTSACFDYCDAKWDRCFRYCSFSC